MAVSIEIITDLPEVGAKLAAAGAAVPELAHAGIIPIAEAIRVVGTAEIRDATPKASGATAGSTHGEVAIEGEGAEITWHQPRKVTSSRGSWILAKILIEGRGEVDIVPVSKQALAWPGGDHPVRSVHQPAREPNPYNVEAMDAAKPAMHDAIGHGGRDILREVVAVMH